MGRKIRQAVTAPAAVAAQAISATDAQALLASLNKASLAAAIEAKTVEFNRVKDELKALRVLDKVRAYRDGEFVRHTKRKQASGADTAAGNGENRTARDGHVERIVDFLRAEGPSTVPQISRGTNLITGVVQNALAAAKISGDYALSVESGQWALAEEEDD